MKLIDSLISFKKTFGRQGNDFGSFQISDTKFSNSNNLEDMYNIILFNEPIVIGGEFSMDIYPQNKLSEVQRGWSTILSKDNQWISDDAKWNKNWIVFATRDEDAIYYNEIDGGVYGSIEKEIFYKLSDSLSEFFHVLSECLKMEETVFHFDTTDDDEETTDLFLEECQKILSQNMSTKNATDFMNFFFS